MTDLDSFRVVIGVPLDVPQCKSGNATSARSSKAPVEKFPPISHMIVAGGDTGRLPQKGDGCRS
jgi:hypothetical protein